MLYEELCEGSHPDGRPHLCLKDVCQRNLKLAGINPNNWENTADSHEIWRVAVRNAMQKAEQDRDDQFAVKKS